MFEVFKKLQNLNIVPDIVYTNNFELKNIDNKIKDFNLKILPHKEIESSLLMEADKCIVLLFGYLRILSKEVCQKHDIYNLHPGDIVKFPYLKGKDPIEKYFELTRKWKRKICGCLLGCVLHKVIEQVDEGEILLRKTYTAKSVDEAYIICQQVAIWMWCFFIPQLIFKKVNKPVSSTYYITPSGILFSLPNIKELSRIDSQPYKILKQNKGQHYMQATIGNPQINITIHRLVAEAYIPNLECKPEINHKDGNMLNNYFDNLEWVTEKENSHHALKTGLRKLNRMNKPINESILQKYKDNSYIKI
jgi:folate-dependent phosphoribosylglycinamide formyltransferase PurN